MQKNNAKPPESTELLRKRLPEEAKHVTESMVHVFGPEQEIVCATEPRGHATRDNMDREVLRVEATEGFVPLWEIGTILRYRFQERSLRVFADPERIKTEVKRLFAQGVSAWGDAAPVKFTENNDSWDFEFVVRNGNDCDEKDNCVLAKAFFPDAGRHELVVYPALFTDNRINEQKRIATFTHEVGHIFGLRHWFANLHERAWPSEVFGENPPFTIMNYGNESVLTDLDKADLNRLYQAAWSGDLTHINGTPLRFFAPFHTTGRQAEAFLPQINKILELRQVAGGVPGQPVLPPSAQHPSGTTH